MTTLPVDILLTHTPAMRRLYYGERALQELRGLGRVVLHEADQPLDASALIAAARTARIIVADRMTAGPAEVFGALPELAAFVRVAVDIRNIDVEAASRAGVLVTRASPGFIDSVAELALGFLIDLSRGISASVQSYRAGLDPVIQTGRQLSGSTLGIVGFGGIGRRLSTVAGALGMKVLVFDPHATVSDEPIRQTSLEQLLMESDYVVCLAVATAETECLFGEAAFGRMKQRAFFLNLARGELVDEAALEAALRKRVIAGAALDVGRGPDQMPTLRIAALPNLIATPHVGGLTLPAMEHQALETVRQVALILKGEAPEGATNVDAWSRRILLGK
jgi:D-3-phosphoglycerate dehydrogenase